jgi:integrase
MFGETKAHQEIPLQELASWWAAVGALKNPLRRCMHRLGLLSGLRPGNVRGCRREWIRELEGARPRIEFPALSMKGREEFVLPLSKALVGVVRAALAAGDVLEPGAPWLFPSRGSKGETKGKLQPMATSREPRNAALKDRTGHACRHTWKNVARAARLPESQIELLLAHKLGGMRDTYGSLAEHFERLLEDQEKVSAKILELIGADAAQKMAAE